MRMNVIKKLWVILLLPIFFLKLSACGEQERELSEYVTFLATDNNSITRTVGQHRINNNQVGSFIPDQIHNPEGREFIRWEVIRPGQPAMPFDHNNVGDVREVHAHFSATAEIVLPIAIRLIDPDPLTNDPSAGYTDILPGGAIEILAHQTPITVEEILEIAERNVEALEFRTLVWYHQDAEGNPDTERPIDIRERRFRFVELQEKASDGGIALVGVHHQVMHNVVIDTNGGEIANAAEVFADIVDNDGNSLVEIENGVYTIPVGWGQHIFTATRFATLQFENNNFVNENNTRASAQVRLIDWQNAVNPQGSRQDVLPEILTAFGQELMPNGDINITIHWEGLRTTVNIVDIRGNAGADIDISAADGLNSPMQFSIYAGATIRRQIFLEHGIDIFDLTDSSGRYKFSHWNVSTTSGGAPMFQITDVNDPTPPVSPNFFLTAVWVRASHEVTIRCDITNQILDTLMIEYGTILAQVLDEDLYTRQGHDFGGFYIDGNPVGFTTMEPNQMTINVRWNLIISSLYIRTDNPNELINGSPLTEYFVGELGYFEYVLASLEDLINSLSRRGHEFRRWRMESDLVGEAGVILQPTVQMQGNRIVVFVEWNVLSSLVTLELFDTSPENFAELSHDSMPIYYSEPLWSGGLVNVSASRSIIGWYIEDNDERLTNADLGQLFMSDRDITILVVVEPADTASPVSTLFIQCAITGINEEHIRAIGYEQATFIRNISDSVGRNRPGHHVSSWRVYNHSTGNLIREIDLFDQNGNPLDITFIMPDVNVRFVPQWTADSFRITFDFDDIRERGIEITNYGENFDPIYAQYGTRIIDVLTEREISLSRLGYNFTVFMWLGTPLANRTVGAQDVILHSSWTENMLVISITTAGDSDAENYRNLSEIQFRQGHQLSVLENILNTNSFEGQNIIRYVSSTHSIAYNINNLVVDGQGRVISVGSIVFNITHHSSRVDFISQFDPRRTEGMAQGPLEDIYHFVPHGVSLLDFISEIALPGLLPGDASMYNLDSLGQHFDGGRFDHWMLPNGNELTSAFIMTRDHIILTAYWARSGEIILLGGNQMFIGDPLFSDETTIRGINPGPGTNLRSYLQRFVHTANGIDGTPIESHMGLNVRVFDGHVMIRHFPGRQIYGFYLIGDPWRVNILHTQTPLLWDDADQTRATFGVLVKNYRQNLQTSPVTITNLHGNVINGLTIQGNIAGGNVVFPSFINGQKVIAINNNTFGTTLNGVNSIKFPTYLIRVQRLSNNASNVGDLRIDLRNLPWLTTLPNGFAQASGQGFGSANSRLVVEINPITPLTEIHPNAFVTGANWAATSFHRLMMEGFQDMTPGQVSWWWDRPNFVGGHTDGANGGPIGNRIVFNDGAPGSLPAGW